MRKTKMGNVFSQVRLGGAKSGSSRLGRRSRRGPEPSCGAGMYVSWGRGVAVWKAARLVESCFERTFVLKRAARRCGGSANTAVADDPNMGTMLRDVRIVALMVVDSP
jgi:hypothetical protein